MIVIATLGDVLGGEVEIPAGQYKVRANDKIVYTGSADLWDVLNDEDSEFGADVWDNWPASVDWTVEWEEKEGAD